MTSLSESSDSCDFSFICICIYYPAMAPDYSPAVQNPPACPGWVAIILSGEDGGAPSRGTPAQRELAASAKRYAASQAGKKISLAEIGRALHVSPVYLTSVFREVEGIPFYRYALRKRLERAARLLPGYASDLSNLALELGFSTQSHFATAFRQAFGCSPAAFRERARAVCSHLLTPAAA
jgi:AraC-like DNA-binding protein